MDRTQRPSSVQHSPERKDVIAEKRMRIGIFAFWGVNWDGSTLRTLGCHARYLHRYLELVDGVRLFTSCSPELRERNTDAISDRRLEVVPLPWGNHLSVWLNQRKFQRVVGDHLDGLDAMYVRLFDPCPWRVASLCEARSMGLVFHVVGNPYPEIMRRRDWSWAGRWARRFMFAAEERADVPRGAPAHAFDQRRRPDPRFWTSPSASRDRHLINARRRRLPLAS